VALEPVQIRLRTGDPTPDGRRRPRTERLSPRRGVHQNGTKGEHVAGRADLTRGCLFGRHEADRSDHHTGLRDGRRIGRPGDAEVDDPRPAGGQHHVARLQVPMDDTDRVDPHERFGQADRQQAYGVGRDRAESYDRIPQRGTGKVRRHQPRWPVVGPRIEYWRGEQPAHRSGGHHFAAKPRAVLSVVGEPSPNDLDRDLAAAERLSEVDDTHAAFTQPGQEEVVADPVRITALERLHRPPPPGRTDETGRAGRAEDRLATGETVQKL
jgi:hypothetical protein